MSCWRIRTGKWVTGQRNELKLGLHGRARVRENFSVGNRIRPNAYDTLKKTSGSLIFPNPYSTVLFICSVLPLGSLIFLNLSLSILPHHLSHLSKNTSVSSLHDLSSLFLNDINTHLKASSPASSPDLHLPRSCKALICPRCDHALDLQKVCQICLCPSIMAVVGEKGLANGTKDYTEDGTVDLKGRPVLRSNTGRWRACSFIVGYEMIERMAYYGIASNLVLYLTKKLHEGTVKSSNHVTNWVGTVWMMPAAGAYIADAYLGRYWTFVIASTIYLLGMCLLTLAVSLPVLRPPPCAPGVEDKDCKQASSLQVGIFFFALYIIAAGTGGTKPNISTMGADQFDAFEAKERSQKLSFYNWWVFYILIGTISAQTVLVYIQDNVGFALGYGIPTIGLAVSILVFLLGTPLYRHRLPSGSPLTRIIQVFVAAMRKWKLNVPDDSKELYELSMEVYASKGRYRIHHSSSMRFLDKAAIKTSQTSPWMLCTVTQVEETKQMTKMIPILITTCIPSTIIAQTTTLFIRQGTTLDRRMGPHLKIPPASLTAFINIFMLISVVIYDRVFVPLIRRYTKNPRGITMLQRLGIGLVLHIIIMVTACLVERKRLSIARENNLLGLHDIIPLTIFILLPQFALTGIADTFVDVAKLELFYDQAPEAMKSLGTSYFTTTQSIGSFFSTFLLSTVADLTTRHDHKGWILDNLNVSRLDYYYAFLAVLSVINFLCFFVVAKFFDYNDDVTQTKIDLEMNPASS